MSISIYHTCVYRMSKHFFKKMTLNPSKKRTLEYIWKDPWLNRGQEEELWPNSEPPWGHMDPQVTEIMKNLGFEWDEIQESETERKYNLILISSTEYKVKGHTIRIRLGAPLTSTVAVLP